MADNEQPVTVQPTVTDAAPADPPPAPSADAPVTPPETATEEDVYEALEEVIDLELGLDFVSLGLVYDVAIEGPEAFITFTLPTPASPLGPQVAEQMREFVGQIDGIDKVPPKMVFDPPWSPEMMSEDAKFALGY